MLVSMKAVLDMADARNSAVGSFNITSLECIQAVLGAAEERGEPIIIQFAQVHESIIPLDVIGPVMVLMGERAKVPVCVHLDHGEDLQHVKQALEMGFTSVMYDGSMLPYEVNVANTRTAAEVARTYDASIEAEIGAMGREEFGSVGAEGEAVNSTYTDPDVARDFVQKTGIDALACSFGTVHGLYLQEPKLDFERISAIREKIGVPIVMHGGSGISDADFKKCIDRGVRKINFYTYMAKAGGAEVQKRCAQEQGIVYYHDVTKWGVKGMKEQALHAMQVFANRA